MTMGSQNSGNMMTTSNGTIFRVTGLCEANSLVTGEFPSQTPVTQSLDVFFDLCMNKRLSKQSQDWWFETPSCPLWLHGNKPLNWPVSPYSPHLRPLYEAHQFVLMTNMTGRCPGRHGIRNLLPDKCANWRHITSGHPRHDFLKLVIKWQIRMLTHMTVYLPIRIHDAYFLFPVFDRENLIFWESHSLGLRVSDGQIDIQRTLLDASYEITITAYLRKQFWLKSAKRT